MKLVEGYRGSVDYTGQRFSKLVVIKRGEIPYRGAARPYLCKCDCGNEKWIGSKNLISGDTKSCGCLSEKRKTCEGRSRTKLYNKWFNMKDRVLNNKHKSYKNYGGRGIKIYKPWLQFNVFEEYVIENLGLPNKNQELDRENNDGNYEPGNIRWRTRKQNLNNKRHTRYLTYEGKIYSVSELYDLLKPVVCFKTFSGRIFNNYWDINKAAQTLSKVIKHLPNFYFHPKRVRQRRQARARLTRGEIHAIKVR